MKACMTKKNVYDINKKQELHRKYWLTAAKFCHGSFLIASTSLTLMIKYLNNPIYSETPE